MIYLSFIQMLTNYHLNFLLLSSPRMFEQKCVFFIKCTSKRISLPDTLTHTYNIKVRVSVIGLRLEGNSVDERRGNVRRFYSFFSRLNSLSSRKKAGVFNDPTRQIERLNFLPEEIPYKILTYFNTVYDCLELAVSHHIFEISPKMITRLPGDIFCYRYC